METIKVFFDKPEILEEKLRVAQIEYEKKCEAYDTLEDNQVYDEPYEDSYEDQHEWELKNAYIAYDNAKHTVCELQDYRDKIDLINKYKSGRETEYKKVIIQQSYSGIEDKLGRKKRTEDVANSICAREIKTVGIFGEWGTGKSTFIEHIKSVICNKPDILTIDIKATEYSDQEKIWAYFLTRTIEEIKDNSSLKIKYIRDCFLKNMSSLLLAFASIISVLVLLFLLFKYNLFDDFACLMGINTEVAAAIGTGFNWLIIFILIVKWIYPHVVKVVKEINTTFQSFHNSIEKSLDEKLGFKIVVKKQMEELIKICEGYYFVFFVDELDRCNDKSILSFFESIQLFEGYSNVQIVYAIDEGMVARSLKTIGIDNYRNYLKKYVDLRVDLESVNSQCQCIKNIAMKDFFFNEDESTIMVNTISGLDINISIRDCIKIFNSLSEMKERWIRTEVKAEIDYEKFGNHLYLNWIKSIPIAIYHFSGSSWPLKINNMYHSSPRKCYTVEALIYREPCDENFDSCPYSLRQSKVCDVINTINFIKDTSINYSNLI